jgi:hypothetical protein
MVNIPIRVANLRDSLKVDIKIKAKVIVNDHLEAFRAELYDDTVKVVIYNKIIR